jgi:hypothetical protein
MGSGSTVKTLSGMRTVIGAGAWLTPRLAGRLFGLDVDGNPQAPYLARLFGVRDLALAAGPLQSEGRAREQWLQIGAACDAADAAAALLAWRGGYIGAPTAVLLTAPALGALAMGVSALGESRSAG